MPSVHEINVFAEQLLFGIGQVSLTTALVILPLLALRKLLRKRYPARTLCLIWAVLVVRLLVPVQFSLPQAAPVQVTPRLTRVSYVQDAAYSEQLPAAQTPAAESREWIQTAEVPTQASEAVRYGTALFLLWVCGTLLQLGRQLYAGIVFSRRVRRTAWEVNEPALLAAYYDEVRRLRVRKSPPLRYSCEADSPLLMGLLRPVLLLPAAGIEGEAAPLVLRHELVHYRRRDLWLKLAATVARCVHWFNPAVYLLTRALFEDIELACDGAVVEGLDSGARKRYGEAILDCAEHQCMARQTLTTCFANDKKALKTRLGELFVSGTKKRGAAFIILCALTVGIVGGAVYIGGEEGSPSDAVDENDRILAERTFSYRIEQILAGTWGNAQAKLNYELVMPYLTKDMQQIVFENARSIYIARNMDTGSADIIFDPNAPHYGVPEDINEDFWRLGGSGPYNGTSQQISSQEDHSAVVVLEGGASAGIDYRTGARLFFAREKGRWCISQVDATWNREADSAEHFRLLYENDLGLPDFLNVVSADGEPLYDLSDPVSAAEQCLFLTGGHGEITGQEVVDGHFLGNVVTYIFADGSAVDIVMSDQYGEGYIPVDWRIDGINSRTAEDIAQQWGYGTVHKDTHLMFPLLNENGTEDLIAVQKHYSGDDWVWKHGKYGSSPTAAAFEIVTHLDSDEDTFRVYPDRDTIYMIYIEFGGGYFNHLSVERLSFVRENGWELDHWEEVERTGESMAQWYDTYYLSQWMYFMDYPDAIGISAEEAILWAAGLQNGDLSAEVEELREISAAKTGKRIYSAVLRFTDGSGALRVKAESRPAEDGSTLWSLSDMKVTFTEK